MKLDLHAPTPQEYFESLVQSDEHFPLLEAAASIAQDEYPELDVQQLLSDVDQLQARIRRRLAVDAPSLQRLHMLNQFFFSDRSAAIDEVFVDLSDLRYMKMHRNLFASRQYKAEFINVF